MFLEFIFYLGLGLIVGSFLNVLAVRTHDGRTLLGRSACTACGRILSWYDLVPVVSWLWLLGRCRTCGVCISPLYPLTELATGVCFALIGMSGMLLFPTALALCIAALLIAIARYDISHMLIPNLWVYAFSVLALLSTLSFFFSELSTFDTSYFIHHTAYFLIAGPLVAIPFLALWFFSRGAWMGLGDAKLALGIGWLLGLVDGMVAILGAFVLGAIVGIALLVVSRWWGKAAGMGGIGYTMKSEIPFGPFLIISCIVVWITQMYGIPLAEKIFPVLGGFLW